MPKDNSIQKVLIIGSGPIVIGQAAEFDYSGTQACTAMREEGVQTVLANSNPATIMTDTEIADAVYIEPLTTEYIEKIIIQDKPDAILAGMGGQTGLNLAVDLYKKGILDKYNVRVIGTSIESIIKGEDRDSFCRLMEEVNQPIIESEVVSTIEDGFKVARKIGYPVIVRPAYTLGGAGGGMAEDPAELETILKSGLSLSFGNQVLIEKSIKGWKEIEFEVMRDSKGNCITVCSMENIDPVGIHTGDSVVVAPCQTLSDKEFQMLRTAALSIINAAEIIGGCNVQFALKPDSFEYAVIEINPRVSRSSALASKATGYPIAKIAAKLALGYGLDEVLNAVTKKTYACFEPTIDYVVVKIPKWPFDKFESDNKLLGTRMMATGETMAIGANFEQALLKAVRSLEIGSFSLWHAPSEARGMAELKERIIHPDDERIFDIAALLRRKYSFERIAQVTGIDRFFIEKLRGIVEKEEMLTKMRLEDLDENCLRELKKRGFADKGIADLMGVKEEEIFNLRKKYNIIPSYKLVDTCAAEFEAVSPYYYSTYDDFDESVISDNKKVVVVGSGPIRIGQGIEFDYCCVHSVFTLKKQGIEAIVINNNPETVSTDFDISDKLYFEPLAEEDFYNIIEKEKPDGVILQFGGQTAIKLANFCTKKNIPIIGTQPKSIDAAEDREKFDAILEELQINRPRGKGVWTMDEGILAADEIGYPVLVRPSYVLGGRGMEICYEQASLEKYLRDAFRFDTENPVLIDKYIYGTELEIDAVCDGEDVLIPGIMQHLEKAGVHSGDSITIYPPVGMKQEIKDKIYDYTKRIATKMEVMGIINIQFIEQDGEVYIIEVNPRSSRTVPYISKISGLPIIPLAVRVSLGEKLKDMKCGTGLYPESDLFGIKIPVFSTEKIPGIEAVLGPQMRSTGEVMGVAENYEDALYKGLCAAGMDLAKFKNKILITLNNNDKEQFVPLIAKLAEMDFEILATAGTAQALEEHGVKAQVVNKIKGQKPTMLDVIRGREINLIINTPEKTENSQSDAFKMRRAAIESKVEIITTLEKAREVVKLLFMKINHASQKVYDICKLYYKKDEENGL